MENNKTFLSHVAADLLKRFGGNLARVAVVFPNKRASLFLNQELARQAGHPIWSPAYITISELFTSQSKLRVADPIKAVCDLYRSYIEVTGDSSADNTLDRFYGWGQLLLADFDDIDKNMAEAQLVFRNLAGLHEMDDLSYLTDEQRKLVERFFSNFDADGDPTSKLKQNFLKVWNRLSDVYDNFRHRLEQQQLAYEGMLYRQVVDSLVLNLEYEHYVFVGFNVLQQVEQMLFKHIKRDSNALFYWNFDRYYVPREDNSKPAFARPLNEAGVYVRQWLDHFPNALDNNDTDIYDQFAQPKQIAFVGAPTEDIQARYVNTWLQENDRHKDGNRTAIVLADEGLLGTVIHCIGLGEQEVNITTGYPLARTPIASLVNQLVALQLLGYSSSRASYRLHDVNAVLRHPYSKLLYPEARELLKQLNEAHRYWPKADEVPFLALPSVEGSELTAQDFVARLARWLCDCVERVAKTGGDKRGPLFQESVFRMFTLLTRLRGLVESGDLTVDKITFQRLLKQLINDASIPFHGQPAVGVQVMGVLETRNLDFDHVLVLSCNEGNLPRGVDDASFIPHALRKAYGLTTIDNKVAVYSYYFHSLLQRAKDVTLVYNTSPDGKGGGAMSRFMLQLLTELQQPIRQCVLTADLALTAIPRAQQPKTHDVMERLLELKTLSPSAINKFLTCPKKFFYNYVANIREADDDDSDEIDNRVFGNIFHKAAQLVYEKLLNKEIIEREHIEELLRKPDAFDTVLNEAFNSELFHLGDNITTAPKLDGEQLINREVIGKFLRRLLQIDLGLTPFQVLGHEKEVESQPITLNGHTVSIKGRIDRLDRINIGQPNERLRVVDYKTGSSEAKDVKKFENIFAAKNRTKDHTDYVMQAMAYSVIVATHSEELNPQHQPVSPALFFVQRAGGDDYDPSITLNGQPITDIMDVKEEFWTALQAKLEQLFSPDEPFSLAEYKNACENCPYATLCGEATAS